MAIQRAFAHPHNTCGLGAAPAFSRGHSNLLAEVSQRFAFRLGQVKRQYRHEANFIEDQLINTFIAASGCVRFRKRKGGQDQLAQQGRDLHDLAGRRKIGARQRVDKQRAGGNVAGDAQGVLRTRR